MNFTARIIRTAVLVTAGLFGVSAHADLIEGDGNVLIRSLPNDIVEDFPLEDLVPTQDPLESIDYSPGSVAFKDGAGDFLPAEDPSDPDWWQGDGLVYTTTTDTMWVEFHDLNVIGFTFRLGANMGARAWIRAYYSDDNEATGTFWSGWFGGIDPDTSPSYGVFVTNQSACRKLDRIEIDPPATFTWGLGDMQIATSDACTTQVPEPGSLGLLGAGLLAMGFVWRTRRRVVQL
ncbi:PEP-CTERM sorting domain-containing protein [Lentisalinibacter orientalis]|uniref:PEP-CTERM sorting domain-containing protein n=1 Tax=Lentisalinibacter orientalis TaxID=2992241 RepID=UPI0038689408